jgi:hypothetical protein
MFVRMSLECSCSYSVTNLYIVESKNSDPNILINDYNGCSVFYVHFSELVGILLHTSLVLRDMVIRINTKSCFGLFQSSMSRRLQ